MSLRVGIGTAQYARDIAQDYRSFNWSGQVDIQIEVEWAGCCRFNARGQVVIVHREQRDFLAAIAGCDQSGAYAESRCCWSGDDQKGGLGCREVTPGVHNGTEIGGMHKNDLTGSVLRLSEFHGGSIAQGERGGGADHDFRGVDGGGSCDLDARFLAAVCRETNWAV